MAVFVVELQAAVLGVGGKGGGKNVQGVVERNRRIAEASGPGTSRGRCVVPWSSRGEVRQGPKEHLNPGWLELRGGVGACLPRVPKT